MLWRIDEGLLFLGALATFFVVLEIAFRLGRQETLGRGRP